MTAKRLFIIDAMAMAFRNFHAFSMRGGLTTSQGQPVAAVFGSMIYMLKLLREQRPDYIVVATDSRQPTFRHALYPAYKANRTAMPEDLAAQLDDFFKLFEALGIPVLREAGMEADDLIGSIVKRFASESLHCYIVSGDKDFMQLVNDHVFLFTPKKGDESAIIDASGVWSKFGCRPEQVIDILALIGDSSDNVPGVAGIGEKGAAQLIQEFGSVSGIYERLHEVRNTRQRQALEQSREMADLSRQLVTIHCEATIDKTLDDMICVSESMLKKPELLEFAKRLEFRSIVRSLEAKPLQSELFAPAPSAIEPQIPAAPTQVAGQYRVIQTAEELQELVATLQRQSAFVIDTETTGLDIVNDLPIGLSFCWQSGEAVYVPLIAEHQAPLPTAEILAHLKPILTHEGILKIGHNVKFDWQMLMQVGIEMAGPFFDTMIASYVLTPNERHHSLDHCCLKYFQYQKIPTSALIGKDASISMRDVPLDQLSAYAGEDADFTWRLYETLAPQLKERHLEQLFNDIEMPLLTILAKMERTGVFVQKDALHDLLGELTKLEEQFTQRIYALAGEEFNINSPKQLGNILYEKLKIHESLGVKVKKNKSGFSTDVSVLEQLVDHPLAQEILEYRSVMKLKNTYVETLPQMINERTGRLHTSFHQTGTATGRLSSSEPNLQNIPIRTPLGRKIRAAFASASPDTVLLAADYSQIELRVLAHLADDSNLKAAFEQGQDIHRATAAKIFDVPESEVTDDQRSQAKAINFGIIYGMGAHRLARETGVRMSEAKAFIDRYFATYPGIQEFIKARIQEAEAEGGVKTLGGRHRPLPDIRSPNHMLRKAAQNMAINTPIQGTAADLMKVAMIKLQNELEKQQLNAKLILQVHDELIIECPKDEIEQVSQIVKRSMEEAMALHVPLRVEVGIGSNWLEAH